MIFYKQKEIITNVIPNRLLVEEEGGQEGWKTCGKGVEGGWGPAVAVKPRAPRRVSPAQQRPKSWLKKPRSWPLKPRS